MATGIQPGSAGFRLPSKQEIVDALIRQGKERLARIVGNLSERGFKKLLDKLQSLF